MYCAFCGKTGPMTKEHIWPKWLHDSGDYRLKYHSAPDKVLPAEHVIKDVCGECNNGSLSTLDDYAKSLHHRYFSKGYQTIKKETFKYDFEKLTKWLLKVSYNSARTSRAPDAALLRQYASCILAPGCLPVSVHVLVSLLGQLISVDPSTGLTRAIELTWCRCGRVELPASQSAVMSVRTIIIHSWRFVLVIMKEGKQQYGDMEPILSKLNGAVIRPNNSRTKIPTIPIATESLLAHFNDKQHLYREGARKFDST